MDLLLEKNIIALIMVIEISLVYPLKKRVERRTRIWG